MSEHLDQLRRRLAEQTDQGWIDDRVTTDRLAGMRRRFSELEHISENAMLPPPAPSSLATGGWHIDPLKASEEDLLIDGEHGLDDFVNWHRPPSQRLVSTYKSPEP